MGRAVEQGEERRLQATPRRAGGGIGLDQAVEASRDERLERLAIAAALGGHDPGPGDGDVERSVEALEGLQDECGDHVRQCAKAGAGERRVIYSLGV